jgi:hypothetical protein
MVEIAPAPANFTGTPIAADELPAPPPPEPLPTGDEVARDGADV